MPPIFSFQLKTTFPKIRKKSWRKRNVFTPLLTVGTNSWGLFENMWGFLFVMIRLLDVVAVVMEKDGGCWWCSVCFSEDMKPRLNSGRTDGNVFLCSSKTLRCYFQVTEYLSIFLFFFPLPFLGLPAHCQDKSGDGFSQTQQVRTVAQHPFQIPLSITMLVPLWAYWSDSSQTSKPIYMLLICYSSILETKWRFLRLTKKKRQNPLIHALVRRS